MGQVNFAFQGGSNDLLVTVSWLRAAPNRTQTKFNDCSGFVVPSLIIGSRQASGDRETLPPVGPVCSSQGAALSGPRLTQGT